MEGRNLVCSCSLYLTTTLLGESTVAMSHPAFTFDHIHIISQNPHDAANWYVQMFGAEIVADTVAYGAPQIFLALGGKTLVIRGHRAGEAPRPSSDRLPIFSHNAWGTDHLASVSLRLRAFPTNYMPRRQFPVESARHGGHLLLRRPPAGVSIELGNLRVLCKNRFLSSETVVPLLP